MTERLKTSERIRKNPLVEIITGSELDLAVMKDAFDIFDLMLIPYQKQVASWYKTARFMKSYVESAQKRGVGVIIAAAEKASILPYVIARYTILPVIAVPISRGALRDAKKLNFVLHKLTGSPVATVEIDNTKDAALYAVRILAQTDKTLQGALRVYDVFKKGTLISIKDQEVTLTSQNYLGDIPDRFLDYSTRESHAE